MKWEVLIQKHPDDMLIYSLHALMLGLCFKIDRGDLTVDQATEIFENIRSALQEMIDNWKVEDANKRKEERRKRASKTKSKKSKSA